MHGRSLVSGLMVLVFLGLSIPLWAATPRDRISNEAPYLVPHSRNLRLPDSPAISHYLVRTARQVGKHGPNDFLGPLGVAVWPVRSPPTGLLAAVQYRSFVDRGLTIQQAITKLTRNARRWCSWFPGEFQLLIFYVYLDEGPDHAIEIPPDLRERVFISHRNRTIRPREIARMPGLFEILTGHTDAFEGARLSRDRNQLLLILDFPGLPPGVSPRTRSSLFLRHRLPEGTSRIRLLWPPERNRSTPPSVLRILSEAAHARMKGRSVEYRPGR